jgi:hypothetical protein
LFGGRRRPVARRTPEHGVGDQHAALQLCRREHPVQQLARPAHERGALRVLFRTRALADHHQWGCRLAAPDHGLGRGAFEAQRATLEVGDRGDKGVEVLSGGGAGLRLGDGARDVRLADAHPADGGGRDDGGRRTRRGQDAPCLDAVDGLVEQHGVDAGVGPEGQQALRRPIRFGRRRHALVRSSMVVTLIAGSRGNVTPNRGAERRGAFILDRRGVTSR